MLLCIDIGNSSIGFGLFLEAQKDNPRCIKKIPTHPYKSVSNYKEIIGGFLDECSTESRKKSQGKEVIISSVVPDLTPLIVESLKGLVSNEPLLVSHKRTGSITLSLRKKKGIGADRITNAAGGYLLLNEPVAIVDCGTATTVTVVGNNAAILGGAILPGIGLMQKSLFSGTAKLPDIALKKTKRFLGRDTVSSITSGIIHGTAGAIAYIISGIESELGYSLKIILTGGFASFVSPVLKLNHILKPNLIFEGMRLIYLKSRLQ